MKIHHGPTGAHIFDRRSGLNVLLDEIRLTVDEWSTAPRYMSFALTNACDLECAFCYASKQPSRLKFDDLIAWCHELDNKGCLGIGFGGGEPTIYPGYVDLCRELHTSTQLAITMTTHGHRFTPAIAAGLEGNVDFIRISMDGLEETYKKMRGRSFSAFREKLDLIRSFVSFGINYVVNDKTIDDLPAAADFVFGAGAKELLILPELTAHGQPRLSEDTMARLSRWALDNYRSLRLATSAQGARILDVPALPIGDHEHSDRDFMHMDASAKIKLSAFDSTGIQLRSGEPILPAIQRLRLAISPSI